MEAWDLYDGNRQPLNRTIIRGEQLKQREFHVVVEVWTVNNQGQILLTLRDPSKPEYPDKWENTGGSVLSGETSRQGAVRELFEETGIVAGEAELILLGTIKETSVFYDIYLLKISTEICELTLQDGETVDAKWAGIEALDAMINDQTLALPIGRRLEYVREKFDKHLVVKE